MAAASVPSDERSTEALGASEPDESASKGASKAGKRASSRSWTQHLALDSRGATAVYWGALALFVVALAIPKLLPLVDYPQHLGMAEIARRLADPAAPDHAGYRLNYFTYNALFHVLTANLGHLFGVELAGRMLVMVALVGLGAALVALLRALERPPWLAALFVPAIFSTSVSWGFINYSLGIALAVTTLTLIVHALKRPTAGLFIATALLGLISGFTHVLATALLCVLAVSITPELAWRSVARLRLPVLERIGLGLGRSFLALAPLLFGGLYCIAVYREQYSWAPDTYEDPTLEGTMPPVWDKLRDFPVYTTGVHGDHSDVIILSGALLLMVTVLLARLFSRKSAEVPPAAVSPWSRPLLLPFVALLAAYLWVPMVFIGTHMIFPRLGQLVVLTLLLALPALQPRWSPWLRRLGLGLALATGANLVVHFAWYASETNDASAVIDQLPPGRKVSSVVYDQSTLSFTKAGLVHLAAYYAPRKKSGDFAFNFARYASVPLNFQPGTQPAWPKKGWEFAAADYNPRCKYARAYDVVIVGAPVAMKDASEAEVRQLVFGQDAQAVRMLAHEGRFWAFDTAGLPSDGTY